MQSRRVRVKCPPDRELLAGRREFPAVHISHPAASEDSLQIPFVSVTVRLSPVVVRKSAKEVFFYAKQLERPLFQDL